MSMNKSTARTLLIVGLCALGVGLALFLIYPLIGFSLMAIGVIQVIVASAQWASKGGKTPHHFATHKKTHH